MRKKHLVGFMVLAVAAGELSAAAADVLILRSMGTAANRFPAGRRVPDNTSFQLSPGDQVVVLAGTTTRTFRGPGRFSATGPASSQYANAQVRRQTGAVRGPGDMEVRLPNDVWQVDVTQRGAFCQLPGRRPILWRPVSSQSIQLTIEAPTGTRQTLTWPAGQETLAWPANLPVADNGSYLLSWTGGVSPTRLTAKTLANLSPDNVEAVANALVANRCRPQLDVLIATRDADKLPTNGGRGGAGAPR